MSDLNYPNARDCQHGQLRRSCPHCEYDRDMAEANETIQQLQTKLAESEARVGRLEEAARRSHAVLRVRGYSHTARKILKVLNETKSQSLQHIQAEAIKTMLDKAPVEMFYDAGYVNDMWIEGYANQLRQQQTSEEHQIYPKGDLLSDKPFTIHEDYKTNGSDGE